MCKNHFFPLILSLFLFLFSCNGIDNQKIVKSKAEKSKIEKLKVPIVKNKIKINVSSPKKELTTKAPKLKLSTQITDAGLVYPTTPLTTYKGQASPMIFGQFYQAGLSEGNCGGNPPDSVIAYVGYGPQGTQPDPDGANYSPLWKWFPAQWNSQCSGCGQNNCEYMGTLIINEAGTWAFTFKFSSDGGVTWKYADYNWVPADGHPELDQLGQITVSEFPAPKWADTYKSSEDKEWQANEFTVGNQKNPEVSADPNYVIHFYGDDGYLAKGVWTIVWQSFAQGNGSSYDIYARRFINGQYVYDPYTNDNGEKFRDIFWGEPFRVNTTVDGTQENPAVALDKAAFKDYIVFVWQSKTGLDFDIKGRIFNKTTGEPLTTEFTVNSVTNYDQKNPHVAIENGRIVVVWQSYNGDGNNYGVKAKVYYFDGTNLSVIKYNNEEEFTVNEYTNADQKDPRVAIQPANANGDYKFAVVWASTGQDNDGAGIFLKEFYIKGDNSSVNEISDEVQVNVTYESSQQYPDITTIGPDSYAITWESLKQEGSDKGYGIYTRIYDGWDTQAQNAVMFPATDFHVNTTSDGDQRFPKVAGGKNGEFTITWQSFGTDGDDNGVYYQRFFANLSDNTLEKVEGEIKVNEYTANNQQNPAIAMYKQDSGNLSFVIVYESEGQDSSGMGIYGRRYSVDNDGDGVGYDGDNCKLVRNPDQLDPDNDLLGNACDNCKSVQIDCFKCKWGDGNGGSADCSEDEKVQFCTNTENFDQLDSDGDGLGDVCDNCKLVKNTAMDGDANYDKFYQIDFDGDNIGDACDTDDDADGVPDVDEDANNGQDNPDGDIVNGLPFISRHDDDSDGDGISDPEEYNVVCDPYTGTDTPGKNAVASHDCDGDGILNNYDPDSDNDGIPDSFEGNKDSDNDNYKDYVDTDSNNDTITDYRKVHYADDSAIYAWTGYPKPGDTYDGVPGDGTGNIADFDYDGDLIPDHLDNDMDNDKIADKVEDVGTTEAPITDDNVRNLDSDKYWNWQDTDSDSDGVLDSRELDENPDGDAKLSFVDDDSDGDGMTDAHESGNDRPIVGGSPIADDFDGDGTINSHDFDSDNDGILDYIEWANEPLVNVDQANHIYKDKDGDGKEGWFDNDSDADGIPDMHEAGTNASLVDKLPITDAKRGACSDALTGKATDFTQANSPQTLVLSDKYQDCDGDGIINSYDDDSDEDGVTDIIEKAEDIEPTPDGMECWWDDDCDGDGISDAHESGNQRPSCPDPVPADAAWGCLAANQQNGKVNQDADNDGIVSSRDFDSDGDGVLDIDEWNNVTDTYCNNEVNCSTKINVDGDGLENWIDLDSDADGISDAHESGSNYLYKSHDGDAGYKIGDYDGDGILNCYDWDSDADGISDDIEWNNVSQAWCDAHDYCHTTVDVDNDGLENWVDDDSDADGISDAHESGVEMPQNVDPQAVAGDTCSICTGNENLNYQHYNKWQDCDGDGIVSSLDNDSDGDGVTDFLEWNNRPDNDHNFDKNLTYGDNCENWYDGDSDADGITDAHESGNDRPSICVNGQLQTISDNYDKDFANGDSYINSLDLDSDGDGVNDIIEWANEPAGLTKAGVSGEGADEGCSCQIASHDMDGDCMEGWYDDESDGDGISDKDEAGFGMPVSDSKKGGCTGDTDGSLDSILITDKYQDCDNDDVINSFDLDSDNDHINDIVETKNDADGDGIFNSFDDDSDADGIVDAYECNQGATCDVLNPINTDGDEYPDYLDEDSDNDGILDSHESGKKRPMCPNPVPSYVVWGCKDGNQEDGTSPYSVAGMINKDADNDGTDNYRDLDSDGDGIKDKIEWTNEPQVNKNLSKNINRDLDGDGQEAWFDLDSDADGIRDSVEAGIAGYEGGELNAHLDTTCLVKDITNPKLTYLDSKYQDCDNDGKINSLDDDTDADKIPDAYECNMSNDPCDPSIDQKQAYGNKYEFYTDTPQVFDPDDVPNFQDNDSDGDGISDLEEKNEDMDGDGWDNYLDTDDDNDGFTDNKDNCWAEYNPEQLDDDGDGIGNVCDFDYHKCEYEGLSIEITNPASDYQYFDAGSSDSKDIPISFTYSGAAASRLRIYIDDKIYKQLETIPASPYTVTVPYGQHRIAFVLANEYGVPFNGCEGARASVVVKVTKTCFESKDCDDGNICSVDSCVNGKCKYGPDGTHPSCCMSDFDCPYNALCADRLPKGNPDGIKECIECDADLGPDLAKVNCVPPNGCVSPVCNPETYKCEFVSSGNCCTKDIECPNYPCEICEIDKTTGVGTCQPDTKHIEELAAQGKHCCIPKYDDNGVDITGTIPADAPSWGCDTGNLNACSNVACLGHVCRYGKKYFECCTSDADCTNPGKINECTGPTGKCVNIVDGKGTCIYPNASDKPDCCLRNSDCTKLLLQDGGFNGKTYPEYFGVCEDKGAAYKQCTFTKNPNFCEAPAGVPKVVITEIMVNPAGVDDSKGEWIELFNPTAEKIDINGWKILDGTNIANAHTINNGGPLIILPGQFIVLGNEKDSTLNGGVKVAYSYGNAIQLSNNPGTSETITLWDADGNIVDQVSYKGDIVTKGYSIGLAHPYVDNRYAYIPSTDPGYKVHWLGKTKYKRWNYNDTDYGTPGKINVDIVDMTIYDDPTYQSFAYCDDSNPGSIDICGLYTKNYCAHINLSGYCDKDGDPRCNDGNACSTDTCDLATNTCDNSEVVEPPACCTTDSDCADWYPENFDYNYDVTGDGKINADDIATINAMFDECVIKQCVANKCRYRINPNTPGCCITADYSFKPLNCDDGNPCTVDTCECNGTSCADGDFTDGFMQCKHDMTPEQGVQCCYSDKDCNDNDPTTLDKCKTMDENGQPFYQCTYPENPDYCDAQNPCADDGKTCTIEACCVGGQVVNGDANADCSNVPDNTCVHQVTDASCCDTNIDCIEQEKAEYGHNLAYTIDICCVTGDEDPDCQGVTPHTCIHKKGENFCLSPEDCVPPAGKKCLKAWCIANKCRFATKENPDCCETDADCNDSNPCTIDKCNIKPGDETGTCEHTKDPAKPDCCVTTTNQGKGDYCCETPDDCINGCTKTVCKYSPQDGYKKCVDFDLGSLGLCCESDSDCDDNNSCTIDICEQGTPNVCRHVMKYQGCCTTNTMCPNDGDPCAQNVCDTNAEKCILDAPATCTAPLPYIQTFQFAKSYYNSYQSLDVLGMKIEKLSGDDGVKAYFKPSIAQGVLGSDKHARFEPGTTEYTNFKVCMVLPKLNTTNVNKGATIVFDNGFVAAAGNTQNVTLSVIGRKTTSTPWSSAEVLWAKTTATNLDAEEIVIELKKDDSDTVNKLNNVFKSPATEIAFCIEAPTTAAIDYWAIDNVKVISGTVPVWADTSILNDIEVNKGENLVLQNVEAYDYDNTKVLFYLVEAPSFVTLKNYHYNTPQGAAILHSYVDIYIENAQCNPDTNNVYEIKLKATDGYLNTYQTFKLTVLGCQ